MPQLCQGKQLTHLQYGAVFPPLEGRGIPLCETGIGGYPPTSGAEYKAVIVGVSLTPPAAVLSQLCLGSRVALFQLFWSARFYCLFCVCVEGERAGLLYQVLRAWRWGLSPPATVGAHAEVTVYVTNDFLLIIAFFIICGVYLRCPAPPSWCPKCCTVRLRRRGLLSPGADTRWCTKLWEALFCLLCCRSSSLISAPPALLPKILYKSGGGGSTGELCAVCNASSLVLVVKSTAEFCTRMPERSGGFWGLWLIAEQCVLS